MAKTKRRVAKESDITYFLKLVMFLIIGTLWIRVTNDVSYQIPLPIGAIAGVLLARHEKLQDDRKIEYAVLLFAAFVSFWLPFGITFLV